MKTETLINSNFIQRSSRAVMWGGGLFVAAEAIWHPLHEVLFDGTALAVTQPLGHAFHHAPELPAYALLAIGLAGLARRYGPALGWIGKIGLYVALLGFALMSAGTLAILIFEGGLGASVDALETIHPLLLLPLVGALVCGPLLLKAKVLSPDGAWLIIIGAVMFLGLIFSGIIDTTWGYWVGKGVLTVFSAGWTWLGYAFWLEVREQTQPVELVNRVAG